MIQPVQTAQPFSAPFAHAAQSSVPPLFASGVLRGFDSSSPELSRADFAAGLPVGSVFETSQGRVALQRLAPASAPEVRLMADLAVKRQQPAHSRGAWGYLRAVQAGAPFEVLATIRCAAHGHFAGLAHLVEIRPEGAFPALIQLTLREEGVVSVATPDVCSEFLADRQRAAGGSLSPEEQARGLTESLFRFGFPPSPSLSPDLLAPLFLGAGYLVNAQLDLTRLARLEVAAQAAAGQTPRFAPAAGLFYGQDGEADLWFIPDGHRSSFVVRHGPGAQYGSVSAELFFGRPAELMGSLAAEHVARALRVTSA